mmetsp:Transcript_3093/g.8441  ORF Transcript_3093/g.8441 Transcript_3093/m.8441 type:complete len:278 (-) Transcript_3093:877-1710(-)
MLLDVDHGLVKDCPNYQVDELRGHPIVVAGVHRQAEDVAGNDCLNNQQNFHHADDQVGVGHGVLRVHPRQNHRDVVPGGVALLQDGVLVFQWTWQTTVQAPLGEEGSNPDPDDLSAGRAVLEQLFLVRQEQALVDQIPQVVTAKPLPVVDVPGIHLFGILEQKLHAQNSVPQDDFFRLVIFLGVSGKVHREPRAHGINRVQHTLQQLVPDVPPYIHRFCDIQAEQEADESRQHLRGVSNDLELVQNLPNFDQIVVFKVLPAHHGRGVHCRQIAHGER